MTDVELKIDGLENLLRAMKKERQSIGRIGILGNGSRSDAKGGATNALIGAVHEHGNHQTPQRSFLRIPLTEHLNEKLQEGGLFDKEALKAVVEHGTFRPWLDTVMVVAEGIVGEAFATGGYGKWAPLKPATLGHKRVHSILIETRQLANSITTEVVEP